MAEDRDRERNPEQQEQQELTPEQQEQQARDLAAQERWEKDQRFRVLASDTWKVDNEQFRRLARTGEFAPEEAEPEAEAKEVAR
jgi:hypothetical protein